jgi:hypothetical protein
VSWPATSPSGHASGSYKRKKNSSSYELLPPDKQQTFRDAVKDRYQSAEANIRYRCMITRTTWLRDSSQVRFSDDFIQHVCSLWRESNGVCAATGETMVWRREDVAVDPRRSMAIATIRFGTPVCIGNVALVCSGVCAFIRKHGGLVSARSAALDMEKFVQFKRKRGPEHFTSTCAAWDVECNQRYRTPLWRCLTEAERMLFWTTMYSTRVCPMLNDAQTPEEAGPVADRALALIDAQAGRCAISGRRITIEQTDVATKASIDRINSERHSSENIRLTTCAMNLARSNMSDDAFERWVLKIARYRPPQ